MASVYILYSKKVDKFYIGSCLNLANRIEEHNNGLFPDAFTRISNDWELFISFDDLEQETARKIEKHIKLMKSRKYILNLKKFPEIWHKLLQKYS